MLCAVQMLTLPAARCLAGVLAWLAYHLDRRHRLVADDNLKRAFPGRLDDRERDRMVRAVYRHFCSVIVEIAHLPRMLNPATWRRYVTLQNGRAIVEGLLCGRPLLLVTGHLGNWELGGYVLGLLGFTTYAIARKLDNPYLIDFLLYRFRERTGQTILYKDGDFERIQAALAGGGVIATLGDQDAGARGQFVDFFGRPASTHKAVRFCAGVQRADAGDRYAAGRRTDAVSDRGGGPDSAGGVRRPTGCGAGRHRAIHGGAGATGAADAGAVFLAAPPLEARAAGAEGQAAGVTGPGPRPVQADPDARAKPPRKHESPAEATCFRGTLARASVPKGAAKAWHPA